VLSAATELGVGQSQAGQRCARLGYLAATAAVLKTNYRIEWRTAGYSSGTAVLKEQVQG
jgi:hypothetical protein